LGWEEVAARSDLARVYRVRDPLPDGQWVHYLKAMRGQAAEVLLGALANGLVGLRGIAPGQADLVRVWRASSTVTVSPSVILTTRPTRVSAWASSGHSRIRSRLMARLIRFLQDVAQQAHQLPQAGDDHLPGLFRCRS
jgi:hypothetical protein